MLEPLSPPSKSALAETSRTWRRWEFFALLVPLVVFVFLATYNMHRPGLYYDEMYVISPAFGVRAQKAWFGIPIMISRYVGADKAWIYPPIFSLFGISAWSIRLPAVLMSCGTLILGYALVRRILTPVWALVFSAACAVHPGFIFLTKVDWGPHVFMLFLKTLCLVLVFRWLTGVQRTCWSVLALWVVGFWDKFNFVWFVIALCVATCAVYGGVILRKIRNVRPVVLATVAFGVIGAGLIALVIISPLLQKPQMSAFSDRLLHIWTVYQYTCNGLATALMWFKSRPPLPTWTGWGVLILTIIFLVSALIAYAGGGQGGKLDRCATRFCLWCLAMFGIIFLEIALTRQAGGAHHTIMLFPFDLLACFTAAYLLVKTFPGKKGRVIVVLQAGVLCLWVGSNLETFALYFRKFKDAESFYGRFSPRIESLAKYLDRKGGSVDAIYCIEWGLGNQLRALCEPAIAGKVRDDWQTFQNWSAEKADAQVTAARIFPPREKALYVSFTKEDPVFLPAQNHFMEMNVLEGKIARPVTNLPDTLAATYQVFQNYPSRTGAAK